MLFSRRAFARALVAGLAAAPLPLAPARAQAPTSFFKGKVLTLLISSSGGGGYDTLGRLVAKYLPAHLPINSGVLVQNMPGAGGIVATNYLYNVAPKDGTTIGLVQNNTPFEPLMGTQQADYDPSKFNWLGSPSTETGILAVWHTVPVATIAQAEARQVTVGSSGAQSTPSFYARLLNATLGTKLKIIVGYPGQAEAFLAMQRGEVDGYPSIFYSSLMATHPDWVKDGLLRLLVQYGPRKEKALPDVPFASDLVKTTEDKLLLNAGFAGVSAGRPFLAPPGVPADRVAELRQALAATFSDPKFLADANRMNLGINDPRSGAALAELIAAVYRTPSAIVDKLRRLYAAQ
jgi:tripartite-type tricarboxylate transporter receptor subunit TctC